MCFWDPLHSSVTLIHSNTWQKYKSYCNQSRTPGPSSYQVFKSSNLHLNKSQSLLKFCKQSGRYSSLILIFFRLSSTVYTCKQKSGLGLERNQRNKVISFSAKYTRTAKTCCIFFTASDSCLAWHCNVSPFIPNSFQSFNTGLCQITWKPALIFLSNSNVQLISSQLGQYIFSKIGHPVTSCSAWINKLNSTCPERFYIKIQAVILLT